MTDPTYQPGAGSDQDGENVDLDAVLGPDNVDEALDTAYSPPERPLGLDEFGTTQAEEERGETLDQRLAREVPDPAMQVDLVEGEPAVRAGEGAGDEVSPDDLYDADDPDAEDRGDSIYRDGLLESGVLDDGEVGEARAGRLVDPDRGAGEDVEKDLVASDVGIDGGAASAEEAAMHVVDSEQDSIDEGMRR